jgi:DNA-binding IclR family transcriptional regulator
MPWFERAAKLPGKTLAVAILLWFQLGMVGDGEIKLSSSMLDRFGVNRKAAYRALTAMEQAGLIQADRSRGRLSRVKILR